MKLTIGVGPNHTQFLFDALKEFSKDYDISFYMNFNKVYTQDIDFREKFLSFNTHKIPYTFLMSYNHTPFPEGLPYRPEGYVVSSFDMAVKARNLFPAARIDISVNTPNEEILKFMDGRFSMCDCINIQNWENYDLELIKRFQDMGKTVKVIVDQGCFPKRNEYFERMGLKNIPCISEWSKTDKNIHSCQRGCKDLFEPWKYLATGYVNNQHSKFAGPNVIYKFATRTLDDYSTIYNIQRFFDNGDFNNIKVNVTEGFIKNRFACSKKWKEGCGDCITCKEYYKLNKFGG